VVGWYLAAGELNYGDTLLRGVTEYLSGDPSGTRTPYSLSPTGIPVFLEGGQNLVLFSGRLRVGSPMELALAAGNLLLSLIGQPAGEGSYIRRQQTVARWGQLLHRKMTAWLKLKARLDRYHKVMGNALMQDLTPCIVRRPTEPERYVTGGRLAVGYSRSCAILKPSPTWARSSEGSSPASEVSLLRSSVVTWWHSATLSSFRPPAPAGSSTAVGPRRACDADVEMGTTMTDRHPGA